MNKYYVNLLFTLLASLNLYSQNISTQTVKMENENQIQQERIAPKYPPIKYVFHLKDINEYYLYANGGFHADWYVGYNNSWIVKLPPIDKTGYSKAYIGVKLGRAKLDSDLNPISGKIYVSIADTPTFTMENSYFLVDSVEIPKEADENESIKGVDSAKWYWSYIPLSKISSKKDNYISVWAQDNDFISSSKSPIIAAGYLNDDEENVWLNRTIKGSPPYGNNTLETLISGIKPAIGIKLIAPNDYKVVIKNFSSEIEDNNIILNFTVIGVDIQRAWLELSFDKFDWKKITNYLYSSPYSLTLDRNNLPEDMFYLRVAAQDNYENTGYSKEIVIPKIKKENTQTEGDKDEKKI